MKDELGRPMTLLVKAAIPKKNCKTEASESFPNKKEIRRPLLVDGTNSENGSQPPTPTM